MAGASHFKKSACELIHLPKSATHLFKFKFRIAVSSLSSLMSSWAYYILSRNPVQQKSAERRFWGLNGSSGVLNGAGE
jgi:hypothetical protein